MVVSLEARARYPAGLLLFGTSQVQWGWPVTRDRIGFPLFPVRLAVIPHPPCKAPGRQSGEREARFPTSEPASSFQADELISLRDGSTFPSPSMTGSLGLRLKAGASFKLPCELAEVSWFSGIRPRSRKAGLFRGVCYLTVT